MRITFILLLLFSNFRGFTQELPPIQNYAPIDYDAGTQNWAISQSGEKLIYVANNDGLLEFNGAQWKLYPSPNGTLIRSVHVVEDLIYTGCYMEFGYWKRNEFGNLIYFSLTNQLKEDLIEDEQFWNILEFEKWLLFQSLDRIYIYDTKEKSFNILEARSIRAEIFNVDGTIYFQKVNEGIFKIENGRSVLVSDDTLIRENIVIGVFNRNDRVLILTERGEFYFLTPDGLERWNIKGSKELSSVNVYSSLRLEDGSFILGTISNGIYQLNDSGEVIRKINQQKGLNNNTVLSIFEDMENNLWLGLDNGISSINLNSPFNEYIDKIGKLGVVYTAVIYKGILYLGTNQGLFYKRQDEEGDFEFVKKTNGQVWCLRVIGNTLFCGHNAGTFVIDDNTARKISDFPGTWDLKPLSDNPELILQGNYTGLSVIQKSNDIWQFRNKIEGFDISSRFIERIEERYILVNHEYKGIFKISVDEDFRSVINIKEETSKGIGSSLISYNSNPLYTTNNGVFKYQKEEHKFYLDTLLTGKLFNEDDPIIGVLSADNIANKLWGFTESNIVYVSPGKFDNEPTAVRIAVPSFFRRDLGVPGFEFITPLNEHLYLIGITNGYITLDLKKLRSKEYAISISNIYQEFYDTAGSKIPFNGDNEFEFEENNLHFSYNVAEYDKYSEVNYQYRLDGMYDNWSSWSSIPEISFKNLPYGDYVFNVRAKVGNTLTNNTASYSFSIKKPWYLSNMAILLYILVFVLISFLIHRSYRAYYHKKQNRLLQENKKKLKRKKLKAQKKIIQIKNEQLKLKIESKNRELAASTMSIIRKNEFLNTIKDQLQDSESTHQIKTVIRTIDRNINDSDDWKLFEEAFNNADKGFLKKIKKMHPELSPNDLRLCAYLRLNLSSKEIAPLLNISVRSVEVKRYRLRKKLQMKHENSLTDYILHL
ncbi:triple tyrosine motif-containing protein [uncultured Eudoraea sp.]|uniref:helix-turn-helix and ligand-binding sensor domain-containing protein n=1 Tax=uncultured Eudoraea sp. TaxID=1035614 RepID=UPI0026142D7E|nr:triple tyrosine motif-containing protein [uncultured Eudoraea sp.]